MCTQAIYGHPCHWLHLIYGEDAVVCNGVDAMEVGVVFERVCSRILLEYSSNSTTQQVHLSSSSSSSSSDD